jgi:hypothetical protein
MTKDDQRLILIAHALSGSAYQTKESPSDIARRAVEIASAVLGQLVREEDEHERQKPRAIEPPPIIRNRALVPGG